MKLDMWNLYKKINGLKSGISVPNVERILKP
jgi:hypothetical protein